MNSLGKHLAALFGGCYVFGGNLYRPFESFAHAGAKIRLRVLDPITMIGPDLGALQGAKNIEASGQAIARYHRVLLFADKSAHFLCGVLKCCRHFWPDSMLLRRQAEIRLGLNLSALVVMLIYLCRIRFVRVIRVGKKQHLVHPPGSADPFPSPVVDMDRLHRLVIFRRHGTPPVSIACAQV